MSEDDETTDSTEAVTPASESATTSDDGERHSVHIPQWLAGALVVVLAFLIGAVGYAIGASSNDGGSRDFRPINASQQGGQQGGQGGGFPGGPGGQQGGPQAGPGGQQGPGGGFPGGGPQFDDERGDRQDQDTPDDSTDDQDEDANS